MPLTERDAASNVEFQRFLYDAANPTRRYLHRARRDFVLRWIESYGRGGAALEVGIGADIYGPAIRGRFSPFARLDLEMEYLRSAGKAPRCPDDPPTLYARGDVASLPFRDNAFDFILFSEVLEHVPPACSAAALRELKRVKKPSGILLVSTPQKFSPLELMGRITFGTPLHRIAASLYSDPVRDPGHRNLLSRSSLARQFAIAGLDILEEGNCGLYLPFLAEFGGNRGAGILARVGEIAAGTRFRSLLWTQLFVLR